MSKTLRVALLGCGQIADAHLQELRKQANCQVVAVCDVYPDLAMQAAMRFGVPGQFSDLATMLAESRPDVVHITTPAQTHFSLAHQVLSAGCHVYVEKPLTLTAPEAEQLVTLAQQNGLGLCVGHDQLFDPLWLTLQARVARGEIGPVRFVESFVGYPIAGQFGAQVTKDPKHWVRKLPGGLFHNTISHPLYRIADFLPDASPIVSAQWFCGQGYDFPTELRVQLRGKEVLGSLTFTSNVYAQRLTRVYGTKGMLEIDPDALVIRRHRLSPLPGAFGKLEVPFFQLRESLRNTLGNFWKFLKADIHYFAGMRELFRRFHASILQGTPLPIAPAEMVRVTRLMDEIFAQCKRQQAATALNDEAGNLNFAVDHHPPIPPCSGRPGLERAETPQPAAAAQEQEVAP